MKLEEFIPIKGYEGYYGINKKGEIISYARRYQPRNRILRTNKERSLTNGYRSLYFFKDKKYKHFYVHRLLAMMFLPNWDPLLQVNHKDGIKLNNDLANLEMVTTTENNRHARRIGLIKMCGEDSGVAKLTNKQANFIRKLYASGLFFQREIAKFFNITVSQINLIVNNHIYKNYIN